MNATTNRGARGDQLIPSQPQQSRPWTAAAEERDVDKAMRVVQVLASCVRKCCEEKKEMRDVCFGKVFGVGYASSPGSFRIGGGVSGPRAHY